MSNKEQTSKMFSNQGLTMTTPQGIPAYDDLNSLKLGTKGPVLLEDFILREKITHFDHERIPERVVHARGFGAHGYFENYKSLSQITKADIFQRAGEKTPVFTRFSTVAGNKGSSDVPRDVRGFAVKFYTKQGNWDLVGNNIPIFFIQDPIKFPDLVHAAKQEPDRGFPQAATAHDNFWDFASLSPETLHTIIWAMSDRGIPRSFRFMEGFGVHTFRLINEAGKSTYVKYIWKPTLGLQSVVWDEAVKINGADPDFHRKDLWNAIQNGNYPEWELCLQLFDDEFADKFDFDVLDATKLIPEEVVPLKIVGKLVLNRCVDNFFAETEQVAFCTANIVPGMDFTNDPLLQGRNFSYLDTQLKRLGGPNFAQIPINMPHCPFSNFQQDGHNAIYNPKGRTNYFPNSRSGGLLPVPNKGFTTLQTKENGEKLRERNPDRFADHYSQPRQFYRSQTSVEQDHIVNAFVFELSKVEELNIRKKIVSHLLNIDENLAKKVMKGLGIKEDKIDKIEPLREPINLKPANSFSIIYNNKKTFEGRKVGILVTDGVDDKIFDSLISKLEEGKIDYEIVGLTIGGTVTRSGKELLVDHKLEGGPSVIFDAVVILATEEGAEILRRIPAAKQFVSDAFSHLKFIGYSSEAKILFERAGILSELDTGCFEFSNTNEIPKFLSACKDLRMWEREKNM